MFGEQIRIVDKAAVVYFTVLFPLESNKTIAITSFRTWPRIELDPEIQVALSFIWRTYRTC